MEHRQLDLGVCFNALSYAYNTDMERSTNNSPFPMALIRSPLRPWLLLADAGRLHPQIPETSQQNMCTLLQAFVLGVSKEMSMGMKKKQARYKQHSDLWMQNISILHTG